MSPLRACAFLLSLCVTTACASKPVPVAEAEAPACEPASAITVSDPTPIEPMVAIPRETELVTLRLFVVAANEGSSDESLPSPIRESDLCRDAGCSLLLSPKLLGRNRGQMELEVGNGKNDAVFAMEAKPRILERNVELELAARFFVEGDPLNRPQHFAFSGALEPGQITHVGTFYANDHRGHVSGPQVFAVVE